MTATERAFEAASVSDPRQKWRVEFDDEGVSFTPVGREAERLRVYRRDLAEQCETQRVIGTTVLTLRHPVRKIQLKLEPAARAIFEREVPLHGTDALRMALRRRYRLAVPIAVVILLGSLPAGDLPLDLTGLVMALVLGVLWIWSKKRPDPAVFLLDAAWFLAIAYRWAFPPIGEPNTFTWVMCAVGVLLAIGGVREFRRYSARPADATEMASA